MVRVLVRSCLLVGWLGMLALAGGCASPEDEIADTPYGSGGSGPTGGALQGGTAVTGGAPTGGDPGGGGDPGTGGEDPGTGGDNPGTGGEDPGTGGGGSTGEWDIGTPCDNTQQPACGETDMWCDGGACTCGTGQFCAETGACYWEGSTCP